MTVQYHHVNQPEFEEGTHAHANNTNEQDVIAFSALKRDVALSLDMNALAQNTTIKAYEKVDGATYREIFAKVYPANYDAGAKQVEVVLIGKGQDMKVTLTSAVGEGASKDVPYSYRTAEP